MRSLNRCGLLVLALLAQLLVLLPQVHAQERAPVYEVKLPWGVTPPAAALVRRALQEATAAEAGALIVEVDGGGGVIATAWSLARDLNAAKVPIVVWIGPDPVNSGPAGALLLAASGVAAAAPGAQLGFALPLAQVPAGFSSTTQQLLVDDVVKELTGWQRAHGRNADWIERAARSGAVIDAARARALDPPVVDVVAATEDELRLALSGRRIPGPGGTTYTLDTAGAPVVAVEPTLLESLEQLLAVPTVAFVLFVLGAVAVYLELANPGVSLPGVAGGILILAALYGFIQAEVRPLAVLLLVVGLILVGLEHVVLSHGGLTAGGVTLLVLGALWLVDPARAPGLGVSPIAISGTALLLIAAVAGLVAFAVRVRGRPPATGREALVGQIAEVRRAIDPEGMVYVGGALWSAWSDEGPLPAGELVEVAGIENLRLYVRRLDREPSSLNM
jgi:membrane-bound serine protease (ClpP class)